MFQIEGMLDALLKRLAALPATPHLAQDSDRDLNPDWPLPPQLKPAAVLVPVLARAAEPAILLTLRQPHLSAHAGQVSFPGGRIDPRDESAAAAALREADEEVGLPPTHVQPLGFLNTYNTFTGYQVVPLVGLVAQPPRWQPNEDEVAEIIELPVSALLAPQAFHVRAFKVPSGQERRTYVLSYNGHDIWGATAAMLVNLKDVLSHEN